MSAAEVATRLEVVDRMLREAAPRAEILRVMADSFGVSTRAADDYIRRARTRWEAETLDAREVEKLRTLARLDRISAKAERRGAFAAAVGVAGHAEARKSGQPGLPGSWPSSTALATTT